MLFFGYIRNIRITGNSAYDLFGMANDLNIPKQSLIITETLLDETFVTKKFTRLPMRIFVVLVQRGLGFLNLRLSTMVCL